MDLFDIPELRFDLPIAIEKFFCLKANTIVVMTKTPVILDTDIGDDIDDTWALVYLLKSQSLAPKLITTVAGNTKKKGKIVAKILKIAGRTKIPIGFGVQPKKSKKITYFDFCII